MATDRTTNDETGKGEVIAVNLPEHTITLRNGYDYRVDKSVDLDKLEINRTYGMAYRPEGKNFIITRIEGLDGADNSIKEETARGAETDASSRARGNSTTGTGDHVEDSSPETASKREQQRIREIALGHVINMFRGTLNQSNLEMIFETSTIFGDFIEHGPTSAVMAKARAHDIAMSKNNKQGRSTGPSK